MKLLTLFSNIENASKRPQLAIKVLFACIDLSESQTEYILKSDIDDAICDDSDKKKSLSKNTSAVISEMATVGLLAKYSLVGSAIEPYRGSPYPLLIKVDESISNLFSKSS